MVRMPVERSEARQVGSVTLRTDMDAPRSYTQSEPGTTSSVVRSLDKWMEMTSGLPRLRVTYEVAKTASPSPLFLAGGAALAGSATLAGGTADAALAGCEAARAPRVPQSP